MRTFFLSLLLILVSLTLGCAAIGGDVSSVTPAPPASTQAPVVLATGRPSTPEPPAATPEPTPPPEEVLRQIEELDRIDHDAAALYLGADRFLLHERFLEPEANGASMTGPFVLEDSFLDSILTGADALLSDLHQLDRESLGDSKTVVYDTLDRFLSLCAESYDNPYLSDPLSEDGYLFTIADNLCFYRIDNEDDILFLMDTIRILPSCVNEAVLLEEERIAEGIGRSDAGLTAVIDWCDGITDEKAALITKVLKDHINQADGLTRKEKKSYADQVSDLVRENLIPAVKTLKENAQTWKDSTADRAEPGISEEDRERYGIYLSWLTQSEFSAETVAGYLESAADDLIRTLEVGSAAESDPFKGSKLSNSISVLKGITKEMMAGAPESSIRLVKTSDSQAGIMTDPYHLERPPLDADASTQQLLYYAEQGAKEGLFLQIARVYYPGEALIDAVCRSSDSIGSFQKAYDFAWYRKGWGYYAAEQTIVRQNRYDADEAVSAFARDLLLGEIYPALADIQIHCFGYDRDGLKTYYGGASVELSDPYIASLYDEALNCPGKHIPAAFGYAFFTDLMKRMSAVLGERFLDSAVHAKLLSIGPCGPDILRERMDEWADAQISG